MNPFSLNNKMILITGASSGIGKSIAEECARMGAKLIITGRNEVRLQETMANLEGTGHVSVVTDLSEQKGIKDLLSSIPKLDGLVLAAGIVEACPVLFATKEKIESIYTTNLFSPIEILRTIVKKKLFNRGFSIVAIDSIAGTSDFCPANGIYGSGKAALSSFMKYVAVETASKGIRVNTISPGMIYTPIHLGGAIDEDKLKETIDKVPLKCWGRPQDIAYGAVYLLSDASLYITGSDIRIDGGLSL